MNPTTFSELLTDIADEYIVCACSEKAAFKTGKLSCGLSMARTIKRFKRSRAYGNVSGVDNKQYLADHNY